MTSHGGTAIIIKEGIRHHQLPEFKRDYLQATSVSVADWSGPLTLSSVYCPPQRGKGRHGPSKNNIKDHMFTEFFNQLGYRFIAGGDWNAKHLHWGSRMTLTRGRELKKSIDCNKLQSVSTGEPTYWPTDPKKKPDLLDFYITKGVSTLYHHVESCLDGSSDHTAILMTLSTTVILSEKPCTLYNKNTDWELFQHHVDRNINLRLPLKSSNDVEEAALHITKVLQESAWKATPVTPEKTQKYNYPLEVRRRVEEKRSLRRKWQLSRHPDDKSKFNRAKHQLKQFIEEIKNKTLQDRLEKCHPNKNDHHSLWKLTKTHNQPQQAIPPLRRNDGKWARSSDEKAELFAEFLESAFQPNKPSESSKDPMIDRVLKGDLQMSPPLQIANPREITNQIRHLAKKKAPGYDLVTTEVLERLPRKGIVFLTVLFNAIMRIQYFPSIWKISQIILIHKNGKPTNEVSSYRPISLLPVVSKLFERIFLRRLKPMLVVEKIVPDHQFGFRAKHATVEQVHRVVRKVRQTLEKKEYCSAVFLDIQQAFDRVWHKGLLYKIKSWLPHTVYTLMKSYLECRLFQVKYGESFSSFRECQAGVPQGSVLGPVLYTIFTADIPEIDNVLCATYADDTACLSSSKDPAEASRLLQCQVNKLEHWLDKWRIKASPTKSVHITFTLRKGDCPAITLKGETLPHKTCVKYLGCHLDRGLYWKTHILTKKEELTLKYRDLQWLLGGPSKLSLENKLLIYKTVLKPIWMYAIELWGSASSSNVEILQRFQNKVLRNITSAPWFTRNTEIHEYLEMPTVKQEIENRLRHYKRRLQQHSNPLAQDLLNTKGEVLRLKRPNTLMLTHLS